MLEQRQNILITGGTGSLGSALARHWYGKHNITILSREIHKQEALKAELPDARFVLTDICDYGKVWSACVGQDILIHAAALKHVSAGEQNPGEYARVNIFGSETITRAWQETSGRKRPALLVSTDKAPNSINAYGSSKFIAERLFLAAGYSAIRYGNVMSSNGSFLPIWQKRIKEGLPIKVRTPSPTRFVLSLEYAVELIEDALPLSQGFIYVPHGLSAISVKDVAQSLGAMIEYEPLLPGEKQDEVLIAEREGAGQASDLLARVVSPEEGDMDRERFCSATARQMTGEEVLGWLSS